MHFLILTFGLVSGLMMSSESEALIISEIMPAPSVNDEWIELYNNSDVSINLSGFSIMDLASNRGTVLRNDINIKPHEYCILARNFQTIQDLQLDAETPSVTLEGWAALNNDADHVYLHDQHGNMIDEMSYGKDNSLLKGFSLERIYCGDDGGDAGNPSPSWGRCVAAEGHTAGRPNSLRPGRQDVQISLRAEPNPFSPDGDGQDDKTVIEFELPLNTARIRVDIYNLRGYRVSCIASNLYAGSVLPALTWDGKDDKGKLLPVGRYIVLLEALDYESGKAFTGKCTVVLAKR